MFIHIVRYIKKIDKEIFSKPAPVKLVWRRPGWAPASYLTDTKGREEMPSKEWYEVAVLSRQGDDFSRATHEIRHRIQRRNLEMVLFTKDKLIRILRKTKNNAKIQRILDYFEAIGEELSHLEEDAIIVEKLIEYSEDPDKFKMAILWLKQESDRIF